MALPLMSVFPPTVMVVRGPGTFLEGSAVPVAADGSAVASAAPAAMGAWRQVEGRAGAGRKHFSNLREL